MSEPQHTSQSLSEIGHLFLSSVRHRQTEGAALPNRKPPGTAREPVMVTVPLRERDRATKPTTATPEVEQLRFLENAAAHTLELFPCLARVKVLRQWAGLCDMPPDFAPIMGAVDEVQGFLLDVGWGTYGFKAAPAAGSRMAELIATGRTPDVIQPFALSRFANLQPLGEKAAAAVSH